MGTDPISQPTTDPVTEPPQESEPSLKNYVETREIGPDGRPQVVRRSLRFDDIRRQLESLAPGWPKVVDGALFLRGPDDKPVYLDSSTKLFAWVDGLAAVNWAKGPEMISQERFFERIRMTGEKYGAIESAPHHPPIPGVCYLHPEMPESTGHHLKRFVDFFAPSTARDGDLIVAMLLTVFWGGPPGDRPAFLVTGEADDPQQGRGIGKTTLCDVASGGLLGGAVDISPSEPFEVIKTRLLSENASGKRVARVDNLKSLKFSWGDLENLITGPTISGRALYRGDGERPNLLTWFITVNGASLSKDMALRSIPLRLKRPSYSRTEDGRPWGEAVRDFVSIQRWNIISDILALLRTEVPPLPIRTRWGRWEQEVLSRVSDPAGCQRVIVERQGEIDDDQTEADIVRDYFVERLGSLGYDVDGSCLFIKAATAAEWVALATGERRQTNRASTYLSGLGIPELSRTKRNGTLGFRWRGKEVPASATMESIADSRPAL